MSTEEDTYNIIFKAMQHPIRRRILRMISEKPSTYTEIQRDLNIDNGLLNYHLEALNSLITKNSEEKYTLSDFGKATVSLVKGVEEPEKVRTAKANSNSLTIKVLTAVLTIALIVSSMAFLDLNNRFIDLSSRYGTQDAENTYLKSALTKAEVAESRLNATLTALARALKSLYEVPVPQPSMLEAYSTNMELRISGVDLPDVIDKAGSSGYDVMYKDYVIEWAAGEGTIHTSAMVTLSRSEGRAINMWYDRFANLTHVQFSLPANPGETFDQLWDKLSRYMHASRDILNATALDVERGYYSLSFITPGEPDWDAARADMGGLVERHTRWIGRVFEYYDSDSHFLNMTGFHIIRAERVVVVGASNLRVIIEASIDEEGDCRLVIYEPRLNRLRDPSALFTPFFESLGLPKSALEGLIFDESSFFQP